MITLQAPRIPRVARLATALCLAALSLAPHAATAQDNPVVVELYTSQGCSSCPPADALLHKLAGRDDVIALALHVDYWDYIGWKDAFARPEHAERQRGYARQAGRSSVYTPQMIINGMDSIVGARGMEISDAIMAHKARETGVSVSVERTGKGVAVAATANRSAGPMEVVLVRYTPERDIKITRGENAGHHFTYANVVEAWDVVAEWSGAEPLVVNIPVDGEGPLVVLLQSPGEGPIQAAARLR